MSQWKNIRGAAGAKCRTRGAEVPLPAHADIIKKTHLKTYIIIERTMSGECGIKKRIKTEEEHNLGEK